MLAAIGEAERLVSGRRHPGPLPRMRRPRRRVAAAARGGRPRRLARPPARRMRLRAATPDDAAAIAEIYAPLRDGERGLVRDRAARRRRDARPDRGRAAGSIPGSSARQRTDALLGYAYAARVPRPPRLSLHRRDDRLPPRRTPPAAGSGGRLYEPLLAILEAQGFTQAIAAITLPNEASVAPARTARLRARPAPTGRSAGSSAPGTTSACGSGRWRRPRRRRPSRARRASPISSRAAQSVPGESRDPALRPCRWAPAFAGAQELVDPRVADDPAAGRVGARAC